MSIDATKQNELFEHSKTISWPSLQESHPPFHTTVGICSFRRWNSHLTSFDQVPHKLHRHGRSFLGHTTSMPHQWDPQVAMFCKSWDFRCNKGYYIGPALTHYRCYEVINKHSGARVISDYLPEPTISIEDKLLHAVQAIHHTIANGAGRTPNNQLVAIETMRNILTDYKTAEQ